MFNMDILSSLTSATAIVPVIVAIVQAFKMTKWVKEEYAPFLAIGVGILVALLLANDFRAEWSGVILTGILLGLASSGLYSGVKTTSFAIAQKRNRYDNDRDNF
jgi:hypothetical protein